GAVSSPYFVTGDHGIAWDVNATSGLWGFPGGQLTVDQSVDPIRFTFTGSDIYAFGGEFFGGRLEGAPDLADITITTSTGASQIFPNINIASFIGFISTNNEPLEWVEISVDGAGNRYATTTVAIAAIPEPATTAFIFGGLTLGAGIWWHRRLKTAQRK